MRKSIFQASNMRGPRHKSQARIFAKVLAAETDSFGLVVEGDAKSSTGKEPLILAAAPHKDARTNGLPLRATLLCLAALTVMCGATIAPSLPALQLHFADTPHSDLLTRLVLSLPALFIALFAPLAGIISDRFGRLPLLLASILLYALAGMSGLLQQSLAGILLGRALLGVAVAVTMTSVTALAGDYFSGRERERFMSQQTAFTSFGGVVFLVGGGLLADWHWRAPFAIYGIALLLLPAAVSFLREPPRSTIDGGAQATAAVNGRRALLAAVFAGAMINSLAFFLIPSQLPFLLHDIGIAQPSLAGLAIGGGNLMGAISSLFLYRRLRVALGDLGLFAFCFATMAAGLIAISAADSYARLLPSMSLFGLGMGAVMPHLANTAIALAPAESRGQVAGGLTASIFLGQFLSPLFSQPWASRFGLASSFSSMGIFLLLLAAAVLLAARRPQSRSV